MIRSMTGFARRERQFPWGLIAWELKTVNHRYLEIGCRLPEDFRGARPFGVTAHAVDHRHQHRIIRGRHRDPVLIFLAMADQAHIRDLDLQ